MSEPKQEKEPIKLVLDDESGQYIDIQGLRVGRYRNIAPYNGTGWSVLDQSNLFESIPKETIDQAWAEYDAQFASDKDVGNSAPETPEVEDDGVHDDYAEYQQFLNEGGADAKPDSQEALNSPVAQKGNQAHSGAPVPDAKSQPASLEGGTAKSYSAGAGHMQPQFDAKSMKATEALEALYGSNAPVSQRSASKTVIPYDDLGDPDINVATNQLLAQVVMKQAIAQGVEDAMFHKIADKLGSNKLALPLTVTNQALVAEYADDVLETYPEITSKVREQVKKKSGQSLLEEAGFDWPTIKAIEKKAPEYLDHLAVSNVHEAHFPVDGTSLVDRLKAGKDTVLQALARPDVKKAMGWAGLAVGCATGGVVITAGMKGMGYLASRLAANPAFQSFSQKLEGKAVGFLSKVLDIEPQVIQEKIDKGKDVAQKVAGSKWGTLGKAAALVGVGIALGQVDMVRDAVSSVAANSLQAGAVALEVSSELAQQGLDSATQGISELGDRIQQLADEGRQSFAENLRSVASSVEPTTFDAGEQYVGQVMGQSVESSAERLLEIPGDQEIQAGELESLIVGDSIESALGDVDLTNSSTVTVVKGDSLWSIAEKSLGEGASNGEILTKVNEIYENNKAAIGSNPNLIHPGLTLSLETITPEKIVSASVDLTGNLEASEKVLGLDDIELFQGVSAPTNEAIDHGSSRTDYADVRSGVFGSREQDYRAMYSLATSEDIPVTEGSVAVRQKETDPDLGM